MSEDMALKQSAFEWALETMNHYRKGANDQEESVEWGIKLEISSFLWIKWVKWVKWVYVIWNWQESLANCVIALSSVNDYSNCVLIVFILWSEALYFDFLSLHFNIMILQHACKAPNRSIHTPHTTVCFMNKSSINHISVQTSLLTLAYECHGHALWGHSYLNLSNHPEKVYAWVIETQIH